MEPQEIEEETAVTKIETAVMKLPRSRSKSKCATVFRPENSHQHERIGRQHTPGEATSVLTQGCNASPPRRFAAEPRALRGGHGRLDRERHWRSNLIGKRTPLRG